jgi:hypothetical protein
MRSKLFSVLILGLLLLVGCSQGDREQMTPRGNLERTGNYKADPSTLSEVVWQVTGASYVEAAPAMARGIVVWGGRDQVVRGTDFATGGSLWQVQLDGAISVTPTIMNRQVIVGTEGGSLYLLHLDDCRGLSGADGGTGLR